MVTRKTKQSTKTIEKKCKSDFKSFCKGLVKLGKKESNDNCCSGHDNSCRGGPFYFLGMVGAAIYYISTATSFWMGALGLLKALVWPAFLVFHVLKIVY